MALDIHSIPAMSANVERLFSSYKIVLTDRRNRMKIDGLEAIECLQSWKELNLKWQPMRDVPLEHMPLCIYGFFGLKTNF